MKILSHPSCSRAALLLVVLAGMVRAGDGTGTKPPESGSLYSFEGTLNISDLKPVRGAAVTIGQVKDSARPALKLEFASGGGKGYPTVYFPVPTGGWDLSDYAGVQAEFYNPGESAVSVYLRVNNEGDWTTSPWSVQVLRLGPGETKSLKTEFGKSFDKAAFALNPGKISSIEVFTEAPATPYTLFLKDLKAWKKTGGNAGTTAPAAASNKVSAPAGASQPYPTETVSPRNHERPYGLDFELAKDFTFGTTRPDATIHNREELDQEFFYRYIYDGGKLDTLPTYWTVHRDYPEGDPRSLHVIGPDNLTLKAHIAEGGGLRKGGIESGMLRGKYPIVPGMYLEMRAKLTKGIGAWPAFWLGAGTEENGKFSDLPWPPEIDIFEFFNWQGRPRTKHLSSNIQVNKKPERFGTPYLIFTTFNKDGEYTPGMDFSQGFHVFALDWQENRPIWILDGHPIKQEYYEWNAPPAHLLVTNQLGITFGDMKEMTADESNWDYVIDYIRIWKRRSP